MTHALLRKTYGLCLAACIGAFSAHAQGTISTIAGRGTSDISGDGGLAISAGIGNVAGVCADHHGNIFIASNGVVRKINTATGIITNIPLSTSIIMTANLWMGEDGMLYITDRYHDDVHKINPETGACTRACGDGHQGGSGDGDDAVRCRTMIPAGSCVDARGNLYVADRGNNKIRKVDATTNIVTTIAGTGFAGFSGDGGLAISAQLSAPTGVCADYRGNVYISEYGNNRIRKIDGSTGIITTIAGTGTAGHSGDGGPATEATISAPHGLALDARGNLFFADAGNNCVRVINNFGFIEAVAGYGASGYSGDGGLATLARLNGPSAVWVDDASNVLIADMYNSRIRKVTAAVYNASRYGSNGVGNISDEVSVFPNPSNGTFTLVTGAAHTNGSLSIINAVGSTVYTGTIGAGNTEIDLKQPAGIYMVVVTSDAGKTTRRITINN